jgi:ZIP family zinc transporter
MRAEVPARTRDALLGFGAGVMLAASAFSLVVPALSAGTDLFFSRAWAAVLAGVALAAGVAGMFAVERLVPHVHDDSPLPTDRLGARAVWLMVFAILIHNFPEGLAIGAAFSGSVPAQGWPVTLAIAIQDVPEGLVVALALRSVGHGAASAAAIGAATGLAEPLGALASAIVVATLPPLYPVALAAAAGAMLFVVSHEIIPGIHRRGHESTATWGVTAGFVAMMVLDNAFGG